MPLTLAWNEIALRLGLTVLAGCLVGINRGEHGRPAGMRTNILVCLAASLAMLQANLLLSTAGKASNSFVVLDLMRLPLGILSGMGFIGGGAILRRDNIVIGVTTAATLWFVTVLGLCFGGGQITLGLVALAIGLFVLWCLKWAENKLKTDHRALLSLQTEPLGPTQEELYEGLKVSGFKIKSASVVIEVNEQFRELTLRLSWRGPTQNRDLPPFLTALAGRPGVRRLEWKPE